MTPREFLARELRRARELKGLSTTDVAKSVFVSEPLVRAWEKGRRIPKPDHLDSLENLYETGGVLSRLREELVTASVPVEWFGKWPEIEDLATALWTVQPLVIPGLLQTEEYARAILKAAHHIADLEEMVASRMERQHVLTKEDPPTYIALISESALRHAVASEKVMKDQLSFLAEVAERENVIIQVIPESAFSCAGFVGGFVLADIGGSADVGYVDDQLTGRVVEDTEDVARLRRFFDVFRADALSRKESIDVIRRQVEKW